MWMKYVVVCFLADTLVLAQSTAPGQLEVLVVISDLVVPVVFQVERRGKLEYVAFEMK